MFIELTGIFVDSSQQEYYKNNILSNRKNYDEIKYKIVERKILINPEHIKAIEQNDYYVGQTKDFHNCTSTFTFISLGVISYRVKETPEEIINKLNELEE